MRLFIHSGRILNNFPILLGLTPSFILKCIILDAFNRKFLDSLVLGLNTNIFLKLSFFWFWILSIFSSSYSRNEWFSSEYCLSWLDLCIMTISPSNVGQRIFPQALYDVNEPNSLCSSLQSSLNMTDYSSKGLKLHNISVDFAHFHSWDSINRYVY